MSQISRNLWPGAPLRKRHSEPRVLADGVADMCCSQWRFNWLWQGPIGCQLVSIYSIPTDVAICCNNKPCRVYQFVAGWNKSSKLRPNQSQMLHPTTGCTVLKPSTAVWLCGSCSAGKSATWWKAHFLVLPRPQSPLKNPYSFSQWLSRVSFLYSFVLWAWRCRKKNTDGGAKLAKMLGSKSIQHEATGLDRVVFSIQFWGCPGCPAIRPYHIISCHPYKSQVAWLVIITYLGNRYPLVLYG